MQERYNIKFALAAVRGRLVRLIDEGKTLGEETLCLLEKPIDSLTEEEQKTLFDLGVELGIKMHYFKNSDRTLPRVNKIIGFLKGQYFESVLDVGSGRGVLLIPMLEEFPRVSFTSVDILQKRTELLEDMAKGGIENLTVENADITTQPYENNSFDIVVMSEVLEHIPQVEKAIRAAVNMARKFVVVTVPSKEDNNPEHIHLLTKEKLTNYFSACGMTRLNFHGVPGHLFMVGKQMTVKGEFRNH